MEQGVAVSAASLLQLHLIQPEQLHARRRNCLEYGCGRVGVRVGRPLVGRPSSTQLRKGTLTVAHLVTGRQGGSSAWRGGGGVHQIVHTKGRAQDDAWSVRTILMPLP